MSNSKLHDTLAEIRKVQEEIEKLKNIKLKAEEAVDSAKHAVKNNGDAVEAAEAKARDYGSRSYWDSRYDELFERQNTESLQSSLYEWYVGYEDIKEILQTEIKGPTKHNLVDGNVSILVAGCGNSSLCEDLSRDGFDNVLGVDYSATIIEQMQKRADELQLTNLKYAQEDVRDMPSYTDESFDLVLDKGTLDAISSKSDEPDAARSDKSIPSQDATAYMTEMCRILKLNGSLIIVTTMPPNIFDQIAINPLFSNGRISINWKQGHSCHNLKTAVGGDVFCFAIRKLAPTHRTDRKEALMNGIKALLDEAKHIGENLGKEREFDFEEEAFRTDFDADTPSINTVDVTKLPKVTIAVANDGGITAGQLVSVSYSFSEELWDEDNDSLCLVLDQYLHETDLGALLNFQYEVFEYIDKPECVTAGSVTGTIRMKFPSFGGCFRVVYVRRVPSDTSHRSFQYYILGLSTPLRVIAPVQLGSADPIPSSRGLHRRGAKPIVHHQGIVEFLEDNRNISTLTLTLSLPPMKEVLVTSQINRVMAWITSLESNSIQLTIEMDNIYRCGTEYNAETIYATYLIPGCTVACGELLSDLNKVIQLLVDKSWAAVENNGKLLCRLPYSCDLARKEQIESASKVMPIDKVSERLGKLDIACKFCSSSLLGSLSSIEDFLPLPSGSLDHMMHEFFCCEAIPAQAMSAVEVASSISQGTLLFGDAYITVHPLDVNSSCIRLGCKTRGSLLDLLTPCGGALATAPMNAKAMEAGIHSDDLNVIVNMDTCSVCCSRCGCYLGDGQFIQDPTCSDTENCSVVHPTAAADRRAENAESFHPADLSDMRLCLHTVELFYKAPLNMRDYPFAVLQSISTEQAISRIILHLNSAFATSTCCLFYHSTISGTQTVMGRNCLVLKLLSRDNRIGSRAGNGRIDFKPAIKLAFKSGTIREILTGKETRIELQHHEFEMIEKKLSSRGDLYGQSPLKGMTVSALFA